LTFDTCDYIIYVIADAISKTRDCSFHKAPNNVILGFAFLSVNNFDLFSRKNKNKWYYTCLHDITLHPNNSDNQNVYYNTHRDKHHHVHNDIHHVLVIDTMATRFFLGKEILHAIEFLAIQKNCQMVAANSIEKSMHYYLRNGFLHTLDWVTFSPWLYHRKMYYVGSKKMNNKKYYSFMYPFMNKVYTFTKPVGDKHNIDVSDAKARLKKYNYKKGRFITRHLKICFPKLKKQRDSIDSINSSKSTAKSTSHGSITSLSS